MGDLDIDEAVHATEVPRDQKAGGAVVVPQGLQPVQASDVKVEPDPRALHLKFFYLDGALNTKMSLVLVTVCFWCILFMSPHITAPFYEVRFNARTNTYNDVTSAIKSYDTGLTLIRAIFSYLVSSQLGIIFAAYFAGRRTRQKKLPKFIKLWLMLVPYATSVPFSSLTASVQSIQYAFAIAGADLGKYAIFANNLTTNIFASISSSNMNVSTADTILRRAFLPPRNQVRSCDISNAQRGNEYVSVAFDFMTSDWQQYVLSKGLSATKAYTVSASAKTINASISNSTLNASEVSLLHSLFTRAVYLYVDAVGAADVNQGGDNSTVFDQLKLDTITYAYTATTSPSTVDDLRQYISNYFAAHSDWEDVLNVTTSNIDVTYHTFRLSEDVQFASISLDIPLSNAIWHRELIAQNDTLIESNNTWPGTGNVSYEIDVVNECGPRTCGVQNRGLAPELKVVAFGDCSASGGLDCDGKTRNASMWLVGFGRRIEGDALELMYNSTNASLNKAIVRNPREYHRVTMGWLTFVPQDLSVKYDAECRADTCHGLSFRYYDEAADKPMALTVGIGNTSMIEFGSSFDLKRNHARGRPLVMRYTTGRRVEYEILRPQNFDEYVWPEVLNGTDCSGRMERCILASVLNNQYIEEPLQVTYTAGLFFLLQNAQSVLEDTLSNGESFLEFAGSDKWYGVVFFIPLIPESASTKITDPNVLVRALADKKNFPREYIDLSVKPPGQSAKEIRLRDLQIKSIEFGPIPKDCGSTVDTIVIRMDEPSSKTDK